MECEHDFVAVIILARTHTYISSECLRLTICSGFVYFHKEWAIITIGGFVYFQIEWDTTKSSSSKSSFVETTTSLYLISLDIAKNDSIENIFHNVCKTHILFHYTYIS